MQVITSKFAAENFLGDTYHNPSHRSVDMIGIGPSAQSGQRGRRDPELEKAQHIWISYPQGHGVHSAIQPEGFQFTDAYRDQPEIGAYFRHCFEERRRRLGQQGREWVLGNFSWEKIAGDLEKVYAEVLKQDL